MPSTDPIRRVVDTVLFPESPKRSGTCEQYSSHRQRGRLECIAGKPNGLTIAVAFRGCGPVRYAMRDRGPCGVYEDGSARGYVVAILLLPVHFNTSGKDKA